MSTTKVNGLYGTIATDVSGNIVLAAGTSTPVASAKGYAKRCLFINTAASTEATSWYLNTGSTSAATWTALDLNTAEAALLSGLTSTSTLIDAATAFTNGMGATTSAPTGHAAGAIGTGVAPSTRRHILNGRIVTEIKIDLEGLASVATANDVIGLSAGGIAYIGQNVVASNGIIYQIELICLETPTGGDNDVNVVAASSGTLAYDGAGGTTYGVNGGDAVAGQVVTNLVQGLTANHYFYLTAGTGDTAAAYTAGQFLIRLHGHPVLT